MKRFNEDTAGNETRAVKIEKVSSFYVLLCIAFVYTNELQNGIMDVKFSGFDWDSGNSQKCEKHGVAMKEIEELFISGRFLVGPDEKHSQAEERYLAIGRPGKRKRPIFVIFTVRKLGEETRIRPISARYMHEREIEVYEKAFAEIEK